MLISQDMNAAINDQVGREFGASLQYVSIAAHFAAENLPQLASHFYKQAEEEREHALKFVKYVTETGGRVHIPAVPSAQSAFKSAEEAVQLSLTWELTVTRQINALVDLAMTESDHLTRQFLQWFVNEQLEEVSSMDSLLRTVQRAGEGGLLLVEDYLARLAG